MRIAFQLAKNPGRIIRGDVFPAKSKARGTLVICHGFKGFKDWGMFPYVGEKLSAWLDVITFNFSHNGVLTPGSWKIYRIMNVFCGFALRAATIRLALYTLSKGKQNH